MDNGSKQKIKSESIKYSTRPVSPSSYKRRIALHKEQKCSSCLKSKFIPSWFFITNLSKTHTYLWNAQTVFEFQNDTVYFICERKCRNSVSRLFRIPFVCRHFYYPRQRFNKHFKVSAHNVRLSRGESYRIFKWYFRYSVLPLCCWNGIVSWRGYDFTVVRNTSVFSYYLSLQVRKPLYTKYIFFVLFFLAIKLQIAVRIQAVIKNDMIAALIQQK